MLAGMIARTGAGSPFPSAGLELTSGYETLDLARPSADVEDEARMRLRAARYGDRAAGRTLEGANPTRYSWFFISLGTPIRMIYTSLLFRGGPSGAPGVEVRSVTLARGGRSSEIRHGVF
jgi:DNA replication and repair protein RecF